MTEESIQGEDFGFVMYTGEPKSDKATRRFVWQNARFHVSRSRKEARSNRQMPASIAPVTLPVSSDSTQPDALYLSGAGLSYKTGSDVAGNIVLSEPSLPVWSTFGLRNPLPGRMNTSTLDDEIEMQLRMRQRSTITGRLGASRIDPFVKFPIELSDRAKTLIDFRVYSLILFQLTSSLKLTKKRLPSSAWKSDAVPRCMVPNYFSRCRRFPPTAFSRRSLLEFPSEVGHCPRQI
jgi:hypothetical protein